MQPVMMPGDAVRRVTERAVRHLGTPRPRAASRMACGHGGEHLFGGARDGGHHHDGEGNAAGEGGEVFLLHDDERVDGDAHDDRGTPLSTSAVKRTALAEERAAAELGEVDAGGDADGDADEAGKREDDAGADDGVGHAAAGLADGRGDVGEEGEVERAGALVEQVDRGSRPAAQ